MVSRTWSAFLLRFGVCRRFIRGLFISRVSDDFSLTDLFLQEISGGSVIPYRRNDNRVVIESFVDIFCEGWFATCGSLQFVTIDVDSRLTRIENDSFFSSGLTSIHNPSCVEGLCESCCFHCESLASVTFDGDSKLSRIERKGFHLSGLASIHGSSSVEVLHVTCFSGFASLTTVTFEVDSKLSRIAKEAFTETAFERIRIRSSIEIICETCASVCETIARPNAGS
jgi:hypothetical protein